MRCLEVALKRALANLEAEAAYMARDNPAAAQRMVAAIEQAVRHLARHPGLGRTGRVAGTRELVVPGTPYIIPYRVREGSVEVLRVFHAATTAPTPACSTPTRWKAVASGCPHFVSGGIVLEAPIDERP